MSERTTKCGLAVLLAVLAVGQAVAGSRGVIIEAWSPDRATGLDWVTPDVDRKDELWNDTYLVFEGLYNRPCIGSDAASIIVLWADTVDYYRTGTRYNPARLNLQGGIVDGVATLQSVEAAFCSTAASVGAGDTLFCYTWGHGGHDGPLFGPRWANHYSLIVGPIAEMDSSFSGVELWDTTFARMANVVNCNRVFIMQQCFSGGFIDDLADSSTTMVCASAAGR